MKTHRIFLMLGVLALTTTIGFSQDPQQSSNYVVIGAFAKLDNAVRYTNAANSENFQAQYAINPKRDLYYVFILNTDDRKKAFSFLLKISVETKYKDAWVFMGKLGEESGQAVAQNKSAPVVVIEEKRVDEVIKPVVEPPKDSVVKQVAIDSSLLKKPIETVVEKVPDGKPFYFKLTNSESGNEVMGEVQVLEPKATQYIGYKGNEIVYLIPPKNSAAVYQVTILAPGYKSIKLTLNYNDPSAVSSGTGPKQEMIINFELTRVKKGDYIDFTNVRFFRNSNILDPASKNELDGLVSLMMENTKYKIKIHGHCNGDDSRDITAMGTSTNFFAMDPSQNSKETATAKKLTELRAETVKGYLVAQGVEDGRVATKGEGGKQMIYPLASTLANQNDRVEIEIVKGK